jgi:hypothetical protein
VACFHFIIHAPGECFYLLFDHLKTRIDAGEAFADAGELANAGAGECVYKTVQLSEAVFKALFDTIKSVFKFIVVHI